MYPIRNLTFNIAMIDVNYEFDKIWNHLKFISYVILKHLSVTGN